MLSEAMQETLSSVKSTIDTGLQANNLYTQANSQFVDENYTAAIDLYTQAIKLNPLADYHLKRSIAYYKVGEYQNSILDTDGVIKSNCEGDLKGKAELRKGLCFFELKDYLAALISFTNAEKLGSDDSCKWIEKCTENGASLPKVEVPSPALVEVLAEAQIQNPTPKVRHEFFQNENFVTISIFIKKADPAMTTIEFTPTAVNIQVKLPTGTDFVLDFDPLANEIVPNEAKYSILGTKIEIKLKKKLIGVKWNTLEGVDEKSITDKPSYPSSSKKKVDWNALTVDEEKPEGEAALNGLFQQIYKDATNETRKAMVKSFTENGGTCLSTNWDEVGKKKVDITPPDGMVAKKYER
jgi:suppressor of G2 allele of SKP1